MVRRFQEVFWPSKWKAVAAAVGWFILAVLFYSVPDFGVFGTGCLIYGLWYALVCFIKFSRDMQLADEAKAYAEHHRQQAQQLAPSRTTPESSQLFVPPPFDRQ